VSLEDWKYLTSLDISHNRISSVAELISLKQCQTLKLEHNSIKNLPLDLAELPLKVNASPLDVKTTDLTFGGRKFGFTGTPSSLLSINLLLDPDKT